MARIAGLFLLVLSMLSPTPSFSNELVSSPCESPQYLELGQTGTIQCNFSGFFGVYWYNSTDLKRSGPFLYYAQGEKSGGGFSSREFDIHPNGSLIIANVSLRHDHVFTVIMYETDNAETKPKPNLVEVIVTVIPKQNYPLIDACMGTQQCFVKLETPRNLTCEVRSARPAVNVTFYAERTTGNRVLPGTFEVEESRMVSKSAVVLVNASIASNYNIFGVISCVSSSHLEMDKSSVLLQYGTVDITNSNPVPTYIELNKGKVLTCCSSKQPLYLVWKMQMTNGSSINITAIVNKNQKRVYKSSRRYEVNIDDGALTIRNAAISDEGIYVCVYGDGINETLVSYNVSVFIIPGDKYMHVKRCSPEGHCAISSNRSGTLTCSVFGIRPPVGLEWSFVDESMLETSTINGTTQVEDNFDGTYDVILESAYSLSDTSKESIRLRCEIRGKLPGQLEWAKMIKLSLNEEDVHPTNDQTMGILLGISSSVAVLFAVVTLCLACILCRRNNDNSNTSPRQYGRVPSKEFKNPSFEDDPDTPTTPGVPRTPRGPEKPAGNDGSEDDDPVALPSQSEPTLSVMPPPGPRKTLMANEQPKTVQDDVASMKGELSVLKKMMENLIGMVETQGKSLNNLKPAQTASTGHEPRKSSM